MLEQKQKRFVDLLSKNVEFIRDYEGAIWTRHDGMLGYFDETCEWVQCSANGVLFGLASIVAVSESPALKAKLLEGLTTAKKHKKKII